MKFPCSHAGLRESFPIVREVCFNEISGLLVEPERTLKTDSLPAGRIARIGMAAGSRESRVTREQENGPTDSRTLGRLGGTGPKG